jgi:hypothetical protein
MSGCDALFSCGDISLVPSVAITQASSALNDPRQLIMSWSSSELYMDPNRDQIRTWHKTQRPLNQAGWRGGNTLDLCLGGPRFELRPGHRISWLKLLVVFLSACRQMPVLYLNSATTTSNHSTIPVCILYILTYKEPIMLPKYCFKHPTWSVLDKQREAYRNKCGVVEWIHLAQDRHMAGFSERGN